MTIISVTNEVSPAVQYHQLVWDSIPTAWPTGIVTADFSRYPQAQPQEVLLYLRRAKSVILNSQLFQQSSLDSASQFDSWKYLVPNSNAQDRDPADPFEGDLYEVPTTQIFLTRLPIQFATGAPANNIPS